MSNFVSKSISFALLLVVSSTSFSAIPNTVNGQPVTSLAPMLQKVMPSVVNLQTIGQSTAGSTRNHPFYPPQVKRHRSLGSGVIVDARNGYILTNNHVIAKATRIRVILHDKRAFFAKVIGRDPKTDVAVIQIKAHNLTAIKMGNSDQVRVGDFVVAIGNAFGLQNTVTSGIISARGRTFRSAKRGDPRNRPYQDFLQTDASINPGNSGGALINMRGELIGINTAIIAPSSGRGKTRGSVGLGFSIPVNMARKLMKQLVNFGKVRRGKLGVLVQDLTPKLAMALRASVRRGAVVSRVLRGSAASRAGLRSGDIIVAINGRTVGDANSLRNAIGLVAPGQSLRMVYMRDGRRYKASPKLGGEGFNGNGKTPRNKKTAILAGAKVANIPAQYRRYNQVRGVIVIGVRQDSRAWNSGLRRGDIITSINRNPIKSLSNFRQVLRRRQGTLLLNIRRGSEAFFLYLD